MRHFPNIAAGSRLRSLFTHRPLLETLESRLAPDNVVTGPGLGALAVLPALAAIPRAADMADSSHGLSRQSSAVNAVPPAVEETAARGLLQTGSSGDHRIEGSLIALVADSMLQADLDFDSLANPPRRPKALRDLTGKLAASSVATGDIAIVQAPHTTGRFAHPSNNGGFVTSSLATNIIPAFPPMGNETQRPTSNRPGGGFGTRSGSLFYGGDFDGRNRLPNEINMAAPESRVYDDFTVPAGTTWTIDCMFSRNLSDAVGVNQAFVHIIGPGQAQQGQPNGGLPNAYPPTPGPAEWTQVGPGGFGLPEIEAKVCGLNITLPEGHYYANIAPIGIGLGRSYAATTSGGNGVGQPLANDNSWLVTPNLGAPWNDPNGPLGPGLWDFSIGVTGESQILELPPPIPPSCFGTGGVDDAEDQEIVWHEFGDRSGNASNSGGGSIAIGDRTAPSAPGFSSGPTWVDQGINAGDTMVGGLGVGDSGVDSSGWFGGNLDYTDTGVADEQTVTYRLRAEDGSGNWAESGTSSVGIGDRTPPSAPAFASGPTWVDQGLDSGEVIDAAPGLCGSGGGTITSDPQGIYITGSGLTGAGTIDFRGSVRYHDGTIRLSTSDLTSAGFGTTWGHTRSWTNGTGYVHDNINGAGTVVMEMPHLVQGPGGTTVAAVLSGTSARFWDLVGGVYQPRFFLPENLTHSAGPAEFLLTDTTGNRLRFHDFSGAVLPKSRGQLKSFADPYGNETNVVGYTVDGLMQEVQRTEEATGVTESYLYAYLPNGDPNERLLSSVTLRHGPSAGGPWTTVRSVDYSYYLPAEPNGNVGDLKTAAVKDSVGQVLDTKYYRYYKPGEPNGYEHGLKYVFHPESFARLAAAVGDPYTAADSAAAPFADYHFQYDSQQRVTLQTVAGAGSSVSGGLGTFTYSYTTSIEPASFNAWKVKTVETLPDGNEHIVFTNAYGQVMLRAQDHDAEQTLRFALYDDKGRVVLTANPSAISGYDETKPDLMNLQGGNYQFMRDGDGLIQAEDYFTTTTAGENTPGGAAGYIRETTIRRGEFGVPVPQHTVQYYAHTAGGATVHPIATSTVYRNENGTGAQTTQYGYTWYANSTQAEMRQVTLPVVSAAQNGSDNFDPHFELLDNKGRSVWRQDADGYLHHTEYDPATGAVIKTIEDVDTNQPLDFSNLPPGWTTPPGGGLHLKTLREVDGLGRTTKLTDPNQNISYITYNDPAHEMRVYPGWQTATNRPTAPTRVLREDWPGSYVEILSLSNVPAVSGGRPTVDQPFIDMNDVETLWRRHTVDTWLVVADTPYFNLSGLRYSTSPSLGTEGVHFYRTRYAYDARGRLNRVESPTGTITRTDYDVLGRPVSVWIGVRVPGLGNRQGLSIPIKVAAYEYDLGGVGDSNLTKVTGFPGGGAAPRVTEMYYDWRNRLVVTKSGVQTTENPDTQRPIVYYEYDNLNRIVKREHYDGDAVTVVDGNNDGVPDKPAAGLLRALVSTAYDDRGRAFRIQVYSVNPNDGTVLPTPLTTDHWYSGRCSGPCETSRIKTAAPGGLVTKYAYDGAGRLIKTYRSDGGGDVGWADAGNVNADIVLEQTEIEYDDNGNAISTIHRQRFHDTDDTGELNLTNARGSYAAYYYDAVNRLTAAVDVGTNGGTPYIRPPTVPPRSDTVLVTSQTYNPGGWVDTVTDPRGTVTRYEYDARGRTVGTIEAYTDGIPTNSTNRITELTYDGSGHVLTRKAVLPGGAYQTTQYIYGVRTATGSDVNSNDLLAKIRYPDKNTGDPSLTEQVTFTYDALRNEKSKEDRNKTKHTYTYDVLGRPVDDRVSSLGAGVDGQVRRLSTSYDTGGRPYLFTSYDAPIGGSVFNQVRREFNGLGQLVAEYQSHFGPVDTGITPKVQYAYSEMSGGANHSRLVSMTYPNGRVLDYNYAAGLDNNISRLSSISDVSGTLEAYICRGMDTIVERVYAQAGVDLTYIKQTGEPNGDAGDQYTGLDRFGRVVDQRWIKDGGISHTDRFQYGYDRNGSPLYRDNLVQPTNTFDELYHANGPGNGYDALGRLTSFARGMLTPSKDTIIVPTHSQNWTLDAPSNWNQVQTDGIPETRGHNKQNQITGISGLTTPTYDHNGNTTGDETGRLFIYDAWDRLAYGSTVNYAHDALGRRIIENDGTSKDLYYVCANRRGGGWGDWDIWSCTWQVAEEQVGGTTRLQYVWSAASAGALSLRDRDADNNGTLEERLYVQQDAAGNTTALVNTLGNVVERYVYDPYGAPTVLSATWNSQDPDIHAMHYLHQGGRLDPTTGLYHFRSGDYSPTLGRWLQRDPIKLNFEGLEMEAKPEFRARVWGVTFASGILNSYEYASSQPAAGPKTSAYSNSFTTIDSLVPSRPGRSTPRPIIKGAQAAAVVGPSEEEIYSDMYGRIKVQFHWDRHAWFTSPGHSFNAAADYWVFLPLFVDGLRDLKSAIVPNTWI